MLQKNKLQKIDKFTFVIIGTFVALAALVVFTFQGVFGSLTDSFAIGNPDVNSELHVDKAAVNEAYDFAFARQSVPLRLKQ